MPQQFSHPCRKCCQGFVSRWTLQQNTAQNGHSVAYTAWQTGCPTPPKLQCCWAHQRTGQPRTSIFSRPSSTMSLERKRLHVQRCCQRRVEKSTRLWGSLHTHAASLQYQRLAYPHPGNASTEAGCACLPKDLSPLDMYRQAGLCYCQAMWLCPPRPARPSGALTGTLACAPAPAPGPGRWPAPRRCWEQSWQPP